MCLGCKKASRKVPDLTTGSLRRSDSKDYGLHVAPDLQDLLNRKRSVISDHGRNCNDNTENSDQVKYNTSKLKKDQIDDTVLKQKTRITKLQKSIHTNLLKLFHRLKKKKDKAMLPTRKSIFANHSVYEPLIAVSSSASKDKINDALTQDSSKTLSDPAFETTESEIADRTDKLNTNTVGSGTSDKQAGSSKLQPLFKAASGSPLDNTEGAITAHVQHISTSDNADVARNTSTNATADTNTAVANEQPGKTVLKPLSNLNKSTLQVLHRLVHKFFPNATVLKPNGQPDKAQVETKKLADKLAAMESSNKQSTGSGGGRADSKTVDDSPVSTDPYAEIAAGPDHPKAPPGIKLDADTRPMLNFGMPSDLTSSQGKEVKEKEAKSDDGGGATHGGLVNPDVPEQLPGTIISSFKNPSIMTISVRIGKK